MYTLHLGKIHLPIKKMFQIKKRKKEGILKNNYLKLLINMFTEQRRKKKKTIEFFIFIFIYTGIYVNFIAFSFAMSLLVVNNNCPHNCYQFHATTNCWSFWIMYELLFDVFSRLYKSSFFTIILNGFALAFSFFLFFL